MGIEPRTRVAPSHDEHPASMLARRIALQSSDTEVDPAQPRAAVLPLATEAVTVQIDRCGLMQRPTTTDPLTGPELPCPPDPPVKVLGSDLQTLTKLAAPAVEFEPDAPTRTFLPSMLLWDKQAVDWFDEGDHLHEQEVPPDDDEIETEAYARAQPEPARARRRPSRLQLLGTCATAGLFLMTLVYLLLAVDAAPDHTRVVAALGGAGLTLLGAIGALLLLREVRRDRRSALSRGSDAHARHSSPLTASADAGSK